MVSFVIRHRWQMAKTDGFCLGPDKDVAQIARRAIAVSSPYPDRSLGRLAGADEQKR